MPEMPENTANFFSEVQSRTIFENVFAFFGTLTSEGFVLSLDGKVFERTTTEPQLLIGQKFSETVYWQASEHTAAVLANAVAEAAKGVRSKTLLEFRVSADEIISIEFYLHPISAENVIFFCAQEVTLREKEIEYHKENSERLLFAAENADIGLWFWDLRADVIYSTPKCNELFEIAAHEIFTFQKFTKIVHPEDVERVKAALKESQINGGEYEVEYRVVYANGNTHWIAARGKSYLDATGEPQTMMGIVRKVTDKRFANAELAKIYDGEKKARSEAEDANRAKDFFLAVVSHELRSPLNAILGWTKILLNKTVDEATQRSALETIEKSARAQAKLIDDLVDSSRVASGKMRLEMRPLNLYEVVKSIYLAQLPTAEGRQISLQFNAAQKNIGVFGDAIRLQQIFSNLLSNALKFTPDGGIVEISLEASADNAQVVVKDNGQGIDAQSLPTIFKQFQQGENQTSRNRSGLGLGLSIVKILSEKHGGTVKAMSEGIGRGAILTVTLPLEGTEIHVPIPQSVVPSKSKPLLDVKILIVEDDNDSREVLHLFLEQSGATVKSAESAAKAKTLLREAEGNLPDIIVSDLAMPEEDGFSLIRHIRTLPAERGGKVPALALSAFAAREDKRKAFDAGFQKYHTKPFEPDGIIEEIREILGIMDNG